MKTMLLPLGVAAVAAMAFAAPAYAQGAYVELNGGPTSASASGKATGVGATGLSLNTGYNIGGGFGTTIGFLPRHLTLGAQVLYTTQDAKSIAGLNNTTLSLMGVINYHIPLGSLDLYGGGGLGAIEKELTASSLGTSVTLSNRQFGWQLQAGLAFPISNNTSLFGEYRYQGSNHWKINYPAGLGLPAGNIAIGEQSHNLTFGVRIGM